MNELKLSLHNFQSISDGELVFNTGLNFIIGQSNSGKSATFRALKACLLNPLGSQRFIKKDTNKAVVELQYNGNEILWNKSEKASSYTINGEEYRNTGKSDAFKILNDETGFVRAEKGCVLMNIEEELQLPFPFGISDSELFKLFENVFCISDSAVILKAAKEHEDKVKDDISLLQLEEVKVKTKIDNLKKLKEEVNIELLKEYKQTLESNRSNLVHLKDGLAVIKLAAMLEKHNLSINKYDFKDLLTDYTEIVGCRKTLKEIKELHNVYKELKSYQIDTNSKLKDLDSLKGVKKTVLILNNLSELLIPTNEFKNRLTNYKELKELSKIVTALRKLHKFKVSDLNLNNKLQLLYNLKTTKSYIDKIKGEIQELKAHKKREEEKVAVLEEKLKKFKVCPLCHHSLEN